MLKSTSRERLEQAIRRVEQRSPGFEDILSVMRDIVDRKQFHDRLTVKISDDVLVPATDIVTFQAEDKVISIQIVQLQDN